MADDFVFGETSFSDHVVKRRQAELRGLWHEIGRASCRERVYHPV